VILPAEFYTGIVLSASVVNETDTVNLNYVSGSLVTTVNSSNWI